MADQNEQPSGPFTDRIRRSLERSGTDMEFEPIITSSVLGRAAQRRRRRRSALFGTALAAVVAVSGAVVATRGDDGTIQSSTETSEPTQTTEGGRDGDATSEESTATTVITALPTLPPIEVARDFNAVGTSASPGENIQQLLPWGDGFIAIGFEYEDQPLPALPDELVALFPDEVRAVFPDGLPPTINEATAVLSEAGLLEVVSDLIAEHPEISEAIYAVPSPPPQLIVSLTDDGSEWTSMTLDTPLDEFGQFTVADDRLVVWGMEYDGENTGDRPPAARRFTIAVTSDLATWQSTSFEVSLPTSDDTHVDIYPGSIAVVGDRWLGVFHRNLWVDYLALLPDDLRLELERSGGYGFGDGPDGLTVEFTDEAGDAVVMNLTWDELGLAGPPLDTRSGPESELWGGDFAGFAEQLQPLDAGTFHSVAALGDEFALFGPELGTSADGRTWTPVDGVGAVEQFADVAVPVEGGTLLIGHDEDGPVGRLLADDGTVTAVELPRLPHVYDLWNQGGSAAWIVESYDAGESWEPITVRIEHEGKVLAMTDGPDGSSYELTDAKSGAVIAAGTVDNGDEGNSLWRYDVGRGVAELVVDDPVTGEELIRIPEEVFQPAIDERYLHEQPEGVWQPDLWLLATTNGVDWLVRDLDDPDPESGDYWPNVAAVNGDRVLYRDNDGWTIATMAP